MQNYDTTINCPITIVSDFVQKNASHTIISFCALSEKNAMKLRMLFLFCLAVLICGVSVAHAQNDWLTVTETNTHTELFEIMEMQMAPVPIISMDMQ